MKKNIKFLIVASNFYPEITEALIKGAINQIKKLNHSYEIIYVTGSLEIPTKISIQLKKKKYDAVIALGCIIRGKTDHYEFIGKAITNSLLSISIDKLVPVSNAILMCNSMRQAKMRSSKKINRAKEAVNAAISVLEK